jgi:hypothetical protein
MRNSGMSKEEFLVQTTFRSLSKEPGIIFRLSFVVAFLLQNEENV